MQKRTVMTSLTSTIDCGYIEKCFIMICAPQNLSRGKRGAIRPWGDRVYIHKSIFDRGTIINTYISGLKKDHNNVSNARLNSLMKLYLTESVFLTLPSDEFFLRWTTPPDMILSVTLQLCFVLFHRWSRSSTFRDTSTSKITFVV